MSNLSDILSKPATDYVAPPPLPEGGYICVVAGLPEQIESSKKKTPGYRFILKPIEALEDVDEDALTEIGGIEDKTIRKDMWVTEGSAFMLREFLENCGIESEGKSLAEMIDEVPNKEVMVSVRHEISQSGRPRINVERTGRVPAE